MVTRLKQFLGFVFAAILLFSATACGSSAPTGQVDVPQRSTSGVERTITDQTRMPEVSGTEVERKTGSLKRTADDTMIDMTGDVGENTQRTLDRKAENLKTAGEQMTSGAKTVRQEANDALKSAVDDVQGKADEAQSKASAVKSDVETKASELKNDVEDEVS